MELTANTGKNESGGLWSLLDKVGDAALKTNSVVQTITGKNVAPKATTGAAPAVAPAQVAAKTWKDYLPWIGVGLAAIGLVVMLSRK